MTTIPSELNLIRWRLDTLVNVRTTDGLTRREEDEYRELVEAEVVLLGLRV